MKKLVAIILSLVMLLTFAACTKTEDDNTTAGKTTVGGNDNGDNGNSTPANGLYDLDATKPAWQIDTRENVTLNWYVNADWWNKDWGNDTVTTQMAKDLNLTVNFTTGDDTTLNSLIAGEEYPDIITVFGNTSDLAKRAPEWAYSLQELADKYDPYFYEVSDEAILQWFALEDGKTYGYPNYANTQADYDSGMLFGTCGFVIRDDVYEAIGKPEIKTQEDFLNMLRDIKAQFPDLQPLCIRDSFIDDTLQDLLGVPLVDDDLNYYDRNTDADYISWLRTFRQAHEEGLISDDCFAIDGDTWQDNMRIGLYACTIIDGVSQQAGPLADFNAATGAQYIAIDALPSTVGNQPTLSQTGMNGWMCTFVSKTCQDPAKAIQTITYLLSDYGQILTTYGIEGETFTINEDGQYVLTPEVKQLQQEDVETFKKETRLTEFCIFGNDRYKALSPDGYPTIIKQFQEWTVGKLQGHFIIDSISPDNGTMEARNLDNINNDWSSARVSMVRAASDAEFDQILENFKASRDGNGWEDIVKVYNEKIDVNAGKLGLK